MRGLLKNNLYITLPNAKVFLTVMVLLGIFIVAMDNKIPSFVIGYMLSVIIGFAFNSMICVGNERATTWSRYKLTAPVKRAEIVKSFFASQLLWMGVGIAFAGICIALSTALHGFPFDKETDIYMVFVLGIGISLFTGAVFFPLFFLGGEERCEVFSVISLFSGIGIVMGLTTLLNMIFPPPMTMRQILLSGGLILLGGVLALAISYPLTVGAFRKKEY